MLRTRRFDFVLCRLSIQIFSRPQTDPQGAYRILEARRGACYLIAKTTNLIIGLPNDQDIARVLRRGWQVRPGHRHGPVETARSCTTMPERPAPGQHPPGLPGRGHQQLGPPGVRRNDERRWRHFSAQSIGQGKLGLSGEDPGPPGRRLRRDLRTIQHPFGYTKWTVVAASGEKRYDACRSAVRPNCCWFTLAWCWWPPRCGFLFHSPASTTHPLLPGAEQGRHRADEQRSCLGNLAADKAA